jgi:predicted transposase YbfD/YdcC
VLKS